MSDDILVDVKSLIDTNWTAANTNNRTPTVINISEVKRVNIGAKDFIFIWELIRTPEDNASGAATKKTVTIIVIDIRTSFSRAQLVAMRKELRSVLNAAQKDVFGDGLFDISDITEDEDLSHQMIQIWRATIKFRVEQFNVAI